ncbi:hypothetical protein ACWGCP_33245, partial [Streptomyces niveus]
ILPFAILVELAFGRQWKLLAGYATAGLTRIELGSAVPLAAASGGIVLALGLAERCRLPRSPHGPGLGQAPVRPDEDARRHPGLPARRRAATAGVARMTNRRDGTYARAYAIRRRGLVISFNST